MSVRPIILDVTRLFTRLKHKSPTGIDRVDLAYARHVLGHEGTGRAAIVTGLGTRLLPDGPAQGLLRTLDARWNEQLPAAADPVLARVRRWLDGQPAPAPTTPRHRSVAARLRSEIDELALPAFALGWPDMKAAPRGSIYLHSSHLRLDKPHLFAWMDRRPDIRPVFFVHDLIPIDFPEYGVPGESGRHHVRMELIARRAAAVAVNSADVGERFTRYVASRGWPRPPVTVAPLGVEPVFLEARRDPAAPQPYFVICSTIEARKNHLLVLQVWRELAAALGDRTPKLVIVGRRGWESESAVDLLDRSPAIRAHVLEATGLSTAGLADLVAGARALLMPSFAEGYGIPVAEALALGTPAIVSDIPVLREVAAPHALFLHPLDGPAWRDAIARLAAEPARTVAGYAAPTWATHLRILSDLLARI